MTPDDLRILCEQNGGQKAVAKRIKRNVNYINDIINGRQPLSDKMEQLIKLFYRTRTKL